MQPNYSTVFEDLTRLTKSLLSKPTLYLDDFLKSISLFIAIVFNHSSDKIIKKLSANEKHFLVDVKTRTM